MHTDLTASLLRATLESTADGILVITRDRHSPLYNRKFLQMWGIPETLMQEGYSDQRLQFLGAQTVDPEGFVRRVWELFHDRPHETALELLHFKDGRVFERYSQPLKDGDEILGRVWSFRDVTERRRAEQALKRQATAIETSQDGIAILDQNQTYLYLNHAHSQIYGYDSATDLTGQNWRVLYTEAERERMEQEVFPAFLQTGHWQGEAIGKRRDGSLFPQEISLSLIEGGGLVCIVRDITRRKQSELALKEAEERYRNIFEHAVVGIYQTTPDGRYLNVNTTLAQMHGYESAAEMMSTLADITHQLYVSPDRRQDFIRLLEENNVVREFEAQVYRKDGSVIWVSENARIVRDQAGTILYYEGTSIDITERQAALQERQAAEAALRRSEYKYRRLFENSQVGIYRIRSDDGLIVEANQRAVELIGYDSPEEVVGKKYTTDFYADLSLRPQILEQIRNRGGFSHLELSFLRRDGSLRWGLFTLQVNNAENLLEAVVTDITDRKLAEEAVSQSESRFRALYEATRIAVMLVDQNGCFDCNQAAAELFQISREQVIGTHPCELTPPLQPDGQDSIALANHYIDQTLAQGSQRFEWVHRRADGSEFPAEVWLTAVEVSDRRFIQAIIQDLSERKQIEAALAERANLAAFRADVGGSLTESDHLQMILQRCTDAMVAHLNASLARIWTFNPESSLLELQASAGLYTTLEDDYSRIPLGVSSIGLIAQQRQPIMTNATLQDPRIINKAWAERNGLTAFAGYPLLLGEQMVGVIALFARDPISESAIEALRFASSEIALGIRRRQAEQALRDSEARFRTIFESAAMGVSLTTLDGEILQVNPAMLKMLGYSEAEFRTLHFTQFTHPDDVQADLALTQEVIDGVRESFQLEKRFICKHGRMIWTRLTLSAMRDPEGQILCTVALIEDIDDRKQAEEALRESEAQYRDLVETANCIILRWDTDGYIRFMNDYGQRFFGYDSEALIDRNVIGTIVPMVESSGRDLESLILGMCRNPQNYTLNENENIRKNGDRVWVMWGNRPIFDENGNLIEILSVGTNISDRKQFEEALRRSELKFRNIFSNSQVGIFRTRVEDGLILEANQKYIEFTGCGSAEEVIGKRHSTEFYVNPSDRQRMLAELLEMGEIKNFEMQFRQQDGSTRWGMYSIRLNTEENCLEGVITDITDRKQAEEALRESESVLRQLTENLPLFFGLRTVDYSRWLYISPAFETISGRPLEPMYADSFHWATFLHPDDMEVTNRVITPDRVAPTELEFRIFKPNQEIVWVRAREFPVYTTNGELYRVAVFAEDITASKRTEEALRLSELKYRNIFESSQIGIGRTRLEDGTYLEVNQRYAEIMGFHSASELIGQKFSADFYANPHDRDFILAELCEKGEVRNFEEQLIRPDGSTAWGLLSLRLNPEEGCLDFVIADISDRKRLEEELNQSKQFLDSIIRNIPLALFTKDIRNDFRYVLVNQNADRILGFSGEDAIGKNDHDLLPPEQAEIFRAQDELAIQSRALLDIPEYPIQVGDEQIIARSLKLPLFDSQGNPTHLLCISEDVTERKRQQEALRLIVEGTASTTGDDFFRACVRYLAEVLQVQYALVSEHRGEDGDRVRTLAVWNGNTFLDSVEYDIKDAPCQGVFQGKVCYYPRNLQTLFPNDPDLATLGAQSYLGVPLTNATGQILGHLAVMDTKPMEPDPGRGLILRIFATRAGAELERKQAEESLKIAKDAAEKANRAKSNFLANMSHELRTPLNAILGYAQLMERDPGLTSRQRTSLATINRSGEHLLDLINDVLEMSKIEAGRTLLNLTPFDLHQLLHTLREMFQVRAEMKRLSLQFTIAPNLPQYVLGDEGKLRQVLINLLNNAIKFTQKGQVILRADLVEAAAIARGSETEKIGVGQETESFPLPPSVTLHFEVEDTGCGIAVEEMDCLFQPFVQTSSGAQVREGTGLGLAISRQFVQLMGGDIYFSSTLGQGSVFCFDVRVLPTEGAEVLPSFTSRKVLRVAPSQPIYRILVVDDRPENCDLIAQLLLSVGFEVETANDGAEAISQWRSWHPHLIWMDMRMPVMSGYEATKYIRDVESRALTCVNRTTKIIALTASAFDEQHSSILAAGCNDLVIKPFRTATIFEKMAEHLGVEYLYEEREENDRKDQTRVGDQASINGLSINDQRALIQQMPAPWIAQLEQAALAVDADQIRQLIEQISTGDRSLADLLTDLLQRFGYEEILELTQCDDGN